MSLHCTLVDRWTGRRGVEVSWIGARSERGIAVGFGTGLVRTWRRLRHVTDAETAA